MKLHTIAACTVVSGALGMACSSTPEEPTGTTQAAVTASTAVVSDWRQDYLDHYIDKSTIRHSFHAHDGDFYDCVDINLQPSMQTPEMKGKSISKPPAVPASGWVDENRPNRAYLDMELHATELDENGDLRACPDGSVPFRRMKMEQLQNFSSLAALYGKYPEGAAPPNDSGGVDGYGYIPPTVDGHEYSRWYQDVTNWGAQSFLSLWNNVVAYPSAELSLSQIWVTGEPNSNTAKQTAEAGWTHYQGLYGDNLSRFFVYWTKDNYGSTGCYNTLCTGFVHVSGGVALGSSFSPISTSYNPQVDARFAWEKDGDTADWWLLYENNWVGYYPASQYTTMQHSADRVAFGGEVYDVRDSGGHDATYMGSGWNPGPSVMPAGEENFCYHRNVQYINLSYETWDPTLSSLITYPNCYGGSTSYQSGGWGQYFYFGGEGLAHCDGT